MSGRPVGGNKVVFLENVRKKRTGRTGGHEPRLFTKKLPIREVENQEQIVVPRYLTTKDVERIFDVSYMTVWNWRKKFGFPTVLEQVSKHHHNVRFIPEAIIKWAKDRGLILDKRLMDRILDDKYKEVTGYIDTEDRKRS